MFIPFISSANAQAAAASEAPNPLFSLGIMAAFFVIFYFIAIRPQRKRQKEHHALVDALAKGDEVATASGMVGKVIGLSDGYVTLKVGDGVEIKFQKYAISAVLPKGTIKSIE